MNRLKKTTLEARDVMSPKTHTIGAEQNLKMAQKLMREYGVRHLPVLHAKKIIGILSDRDLKLAFSLLARTSDGSDVNVSDACVDTEVYTVEPNTSLENVAKYMAEQRIGSTLVAEQGQLVGIITTTDICKKLAEVLSHSS